LPYINEVMLIGTCVNLVSVLFQVSNAKQPGVRELVSKFVSKTICRTDKVEVLLTATEVVLRIGVDLRLVLCLLEPGMMSGTLGQLIEARERR
jgi:hypothetical protein